MRRTPFQLLAVLVGATLLAAACAKSTDENPLAGGRTSDRSGWVFDADLDEELDDPISPDTGFGDEEAPDSDLVVEAALLDVEAFWDRSYGDVYGDAYEPISGGFFAYGPDSEQPPCGNPPPDYADVAENAFYCPSDDLIAWDNVNLIPGMYEEFGGFTLGIVFAHEFGHAIQARQGILGLDTILTELQADCFAGAWTADVEAGNADYFALSLADLDRAVAGFLSLRDGVGTSAQDPAAHGTGFDRIGAFSDGYALGLEHCATYPAMYDSGELVIVEVPFIDEADFATGGNLPLDELMPLVFEDLEHFWSILFTEMGAGEWTPVTDVVGVDPEADEVTCGDTTLSGDDLVNASFLCVPSDTIYLDGVNLIPGLNEIGDYAVATEVARQYAYAAQVRLGNMDNSMESNLQADCFAGLYASTGFLQNRGEGQVLILSPGDLDEAVIAFLQRSDTGEVVESGDGSVGTAFQRFDAFRSGFMNGTEACLAMVP